MRFGAKSIHHDLLFFGNTSFHKLCTLWDKKKSLRTTELDLLTEEPPSSQPECLDVTAVLSWCCYRNKKTLISPCSSMVLFLFGKASCIHRSYNKCTITIMLSVSPRMLPLFLYVEWLPPKVCQSSETLKCIIVC